MASKQWKKSPPGPEQRELDLMFENGLIGDFDTPIKIQKSNPLFIPFSAKVFAVHFRTTKAKFGKYVKSIDRNDDEECEISELGSVLGPVAIPSQSVSKTSLLDFKVESEMQCKSTPFMTWVYTDHIKNCDFVCVIVSVISGARDINFTLSEDGTELHVNYMWPSAFYLPQELFRTQLMNNDLSMAHPKIHAFTSRLLECKLTPKSTPGGSMVVSLPRKVLREIGTWTKTGIKADDTKVVMLEFQAYQNTQLIEDADKSITFD